MARLSNPNPRGRHSRPLPERESSPFFNKPVREFTSKPERKSKRKSTRRTAASTRVRPGSQPFVSPNGTQKPGMPTLSPTPRYNQSAMPKFTDGPIPYFDRKLEVARLRKKRPRRSPAPKIIAAFVLVFVLAFGATGAAFAASVNDAKKDAQALVDQGKKLKDQIVVGEMKGAKTTAGQMAETATKLHNNTSGPLWEAATYLPVVGSDINTVRIVSDSAEVLVNDVVVPAIDVLPAKGLAGIMAEDGTINVSTITDVLTVVSEGGVPISECAARLDDTPEPTISQLKEPVAQVKDVMSTLAPIAESASELKEVLPAVLGANGKRTYLIVACTAAEMRSSIGFAGSFGLMTIDNGKIDLGDFIGFEKNPRLSNSVSSATEEDINLFRTESSIDARDVTQIIDFSKVGKIESEIWDLNGHGKVDGVIGIDTVVLQRMLELTGTNVTTPGGDVIDGTNASDFLLNEVYKKYPKGTEQDAIFALVANSAAKSVFGNIGKVNIAKFIGVLKNSFAQGRIAAYLANEAEEALVEDFGLAGTVSNDPKVPETGVYMSAGLGGKMFFYLSSAITVGSATKNMDGSTTYDMRVEFTDTLDSKELDTLTTYIKNGDTYNGSLYFMVYLLAPTGGKITDVKTEGEFYSKESFPHKDFLVKAEAKEGMNETTYNGDNLWFGYTGIAMQSKTVITYKVTTSKEADGNLVLRTTPLADETVVTYK